MFACTEARNSPVIPNSITTQGNVEDDVVVSEVLWARVSEIGSRGWESRGVDRATSNVLGFLTWVEVPDLDSSSGKISLHDESSSSLIVHSTWGRVGGELNSTT